MTSTPPQSTGGRAGVGRERILAAAGELFVRNGYAATSTRDIANAVGIQQPSLYYHFNLKSQMLTELLLRTLTPSIEMTRKIREDDSLGAVDKLIALVGFDVRLLASVRGNLASLYLLPEVNSEEFAEFAAARDELKAAYSVLTRDAMLQGGTPVSSPERTAEIVYYLVDGVILRRVQTPDLDVEATAIEMCTAVRRIIGLQDTDTSLG